jgi:hypothetical protein
MPSWVQVFPPANLDLGNFNIRARSLLKYLSADGNTVFGGSLSDHLPGFASFTIPRNFDPSFLLAMIGFGVLLAAFVGLILWRNFCVKNINKLASADDMKASYGAIFLRQTVILLNKNFILMFRSRRALCLQLLVPFAFVGLLSILQFALKNNNSMGLDHADIRHRPDSLISNVPRCIVGPGKESCYTLIYAPANNDAVNSIMASLAKSENIPPSEVRRFENQTAIDDFLSTHAGQNSTNAGVLFEIDGTSIKYSLQYNHTQVYSRGKLLDVMKYIVLPTQKALDREILRHFSGKSNLVYEPSTSAFPHPELLPQDIVAAAGPSFFFGTLMFNFVIQMGQIVGEKEFLLRQGMEVMGLNFFIYWFTWFTTNFVMNTISAVLLIIAGLIFQLQFFILNDPELYICLFVLFGMAMVSFACFTSLFISQGRTATSIGFAVYLVGVILQGFVGLLYSKDGASDVTRDLFSLLPFALLGQGVANLASASSGDGAVGLRWEKRFDNSFFPLNSSFLWLLGDSSLFFLLTLLIDGYLANEDPRVWIRQCLGYTDSTGTSKNDTEAGLLTAPEVLAEKRKVDSDASFAVRIQELYKTYYAYDFGLIPNTKKDFQAVKGLSLGIPNGELLCLLGPNGAGIFFSL